MNLIENSHCSEPWDNIPLEFHKLSIPRVTGGDVGQGPFNGSAVIVSKWIDAGGEARFVTEAEGGEQGDPLMPLLFSMGILGALEEVAAALLLGEQLCAFLEISCVRLQE